ncbi:MAG TPA: class I SAM-dependent methyltransferase, partial [Thermoanaerobaculia bacterium]
MKSSNEQSPGRTKSQTKPSESEAYGAFAYAYDRGLGQRFFRSARRVLDDVVDRYPTPKRTHLDLACGTGLAMQYFRRSGWKSTGVDASFAMLSLAKKRGPRVVTSDMRALPFRGKFARITCLYDSLNHMLERDDLLAAFASVREVMDHDSLFLFDVNHPDIYPAVWGIAEPYVATGDDYRLEIATSYKKREKLGRALVTGWAKIGGTKVEIQETHRQRAYSEKEITTALGEGGMRAVEVLDFDPYDEAGEVDAGG